MNVSVNYYLRSSHYDLVTPDGYITKILQTLPNQLDVEVTIENISPTFVGFHIDSGQVIFNGKSALGQLGLDFKERHVELNYAAKRAVITLSIIALDPISLPLLRIMKPGIFLGKLFAADDRRKIRHSDYLLQTLARSDRYGNPLLSLGGMHGSHNLIIEKVDGRIVVYLSLKDGVVEYGPDIKLLYPSLIKALEKNLSIRDWVQLHQEWRQGALRKKDSSSILLVKTLPLHIRTVFGSVANELLPKGFYHCSSRILQPDTAASGDIYELSCESDRELDDIPLEFYSLEPYRENVFFSDKEYLQNSLENFDKLSAAFATIPDPQNYPAAVFIVDEKQLGKLAPHDWINIKPGKMHEFPGVVAQSNRQAIMVQRYIQEQPSYPFLEAIDKGTITSQGILLTNYFPSPAMKRMLLSPAVQWCLKGIYFQFPSYSNEAFFSHEDRAFLLDLAKFAIPVYWVDNTTKQVLQYVQKPGKDSGMFVPIPQVNTYLKATLFGLYGSNLIKGEFEAEFTQLFEGILALKERIHHRDLNDTTPIALVTGGGPGVMELGNLVAKKLGILSCANIVDFRSGNSRVVNEQRQNPHVEAKMTYRLDKIVERQAEFNLDFPIFFHGGIGTDFEFSLEEVKRKTGSCKPTPVLLFGEIEYWRQKISSRFKCNIENGTIAGSEWVSNCFYVVENAEQALHVYTQYFEGSLKIGKEGPIYEEGFVDATKLLTQEPSFTTLASIEVHPHNPAKIHKKN